MNSGCIGAELDSRRSRHTPCPTGKRVSPTSRDLLWFAKLAEHGPLPTSFLLAFAEGLGRSEKRARERLTALFSEADTPHGGAYLTRPPQQFRTIDARYNQLVHDLAPAGYRTLARRGQAGVNRPAPSGPWLHRFMTSCITASIELATLKSDDITYIPQSHILARAGASLRCPVTVVDPQTGRTVRKDLAPDALFGLEYRTTQGSRFRFFAVEADRATEPTTATNWTRKSFERNLQQYQAYVSGGAYRNHLKLSAPLLVLTVTSERARMDRMLAFTARRYPGGNSYMLFQTWETFGPAFRPPAPNFGLLDEWTRAAMSPLALCHP